MSYPLALSGPDDETQEPKRNRMLVRGSKPWATEEMVIDTRMIRDLFGVDPNDMIGEFTVEEILENDLALFSRAWELHWPVDLYKECIYCWSKNVEHVSKNENKCKDCGKITDKRKRQTSAKIVEIK